MYLTTKTKVGSSKCWAGRSWSVLRWIRWDRRQPHGAHKYVSGESGIQQV